MELHEKLTELRKARGITQEALAQALFVSRTAVSKWESGRGYPNIDSLKALSQFYGVTIDEMLSGEQLLTLAQADTRQTASHFRDLLWGLLDVSALLLFFLPFFGQSAQGQVLSVSLLAHTALRAWLKAAYFVVIVGIAVTGVLTLALQNTLLPFWAKCKVSLSLGLSAAGVLLFILSRQPYAAAFLFLFLGIKVFFLAKRQ